MSNVDPKTGIWSLEIASKRHKIDHRLCSAIIQLFDKPYSVADVGCGIGEYCKTLTKYGWDNMVGFEGTKNISSISVFDNIKEVDLTKIHYLGIFDFVLCIEVGEHIPSDYECTFLNNICDMVDNTLLMSWANVGQYSASGHVNCKHMHSVINELEDRGMSFDAEKSHYLQEKAEFNWLKKNIAVFNNVR